MTAAVDRELADYKQVASDLRVGVNHLALDEERLRQEQFLQGLLDLQHRIFEDENLKQHYSEEIEDLKNGIRLNADVLSYLKRVTKLEGPLTELTNKVNEAAIAASSPSAATPAVFANKALTENVNNCWEYIAQLSAITQAHLKDAASYQQFHHMANEVDAHIDKMIGLAEMKMLLFDPQGTVDEAVLLAKELEGDHIELARTWEQTCQLTEMARHLKPIQNRLARVVCGRTVDTSPEMAQNIVMVKALISFSGPDFAIRKGEEMILMKNENPNFWSVKTTFGEREVPSVIFSTVGPNQAEVFKANSLQRKCVSDWKRVLERNKGRLVKYYTKLFEQYCQNEAIYFAHEDAMNDFLDDLDSILIASNYDSGILHRAYEKFTNTLMLLSPNRRPPRGAISLTEQDIRALHAPLRRVLNQAVHVDQVQSRVSMSAEEVQRYLKSVEDERQNIFNEISRMEQLQKEKENQLKSLQQRMISWKTKRQAYDRAIGDYNLEPMEDIMKSFPSTPFAKLRVVENDYGSGGNQYEMNLDEASSSETQSSSYYGKVAKQIVTSHNRSKANGVTFVGEVVKDGEGGGKVWSGNAAILKRSASTNDLQTQILRVTMNTGVQYNQEDHRLAFADISELRKNDQTISTADVQSQILRVTRNATSQVGVRVTPKAIDLSRVDIGNLGLEVLNNKETEGLGFRVGEVLCPVSVGTSVNLYEGPGVQVLGINDVDSLNLELRNAVAHATKDSHRGLKIRDVQSQIITRASNESAWSETQASSEVQTQIGVMNRTAAIQAVAKMEVVNIPSYRQKSRLAEGTSTNFCLLPDKKSTGTMNSEAATSDVMTQISCILHSRGIHSDLQTYLSEYKKRSSLSETTDLGEQSPNVAFQPKSEIRSSTATCDVETLISRVVHDYGTQVSSRLIPTEVTVSKISAKNMAVSLSNPLKEIEIGLPIDSLICPSDMKFQTELYEGSDLSIADYSGVSNFIVKHGDGVVTGSMHLSSVDMQTHHDRGLKTQAAVVLRASKVGIGEVTAQSGVAPKVNFVISNVAGRPFHDSKTPTSDLQTQIRSSNLPREDGGKSQELIESEAEFIRKNENISVEYSTPGNKFEVGQESLNFAKEFLCVKCQRKYREISSQVEKTIPERNDLQTNISQIVTSKGIQQESNDMQYSEYSCRKRLVSSEVQVGLELVPTQISMKKYDIEKMEVEFLDATENENYNVKMNSVSCPARIKVESRLTEGSGVHISGIEKASRVVISVSGSLPSVRTDVTEKIEDEGPDISYEEFKTEVNFVHTSGSMAGRKLYSSKSTQRNLIRLIPCGVAGCKVKTSSETSQVLSVTSDASMQVGSRLVPLAIGVSPVQLENMEISLTNLGKAMSGETSLASALLYPAQVELQSSLVDGQSGIELIPIEQLEYINMNTSRSEAMVQYSSSTSDVITQIITPEKPNLLPASIVLETGQFDGHHRIPNIASQSLVCDLFSNRMRNQTITIRAKPATSNYSSEKPLSYLGYVSTEAHTQTADTSMENMKEESNSAADIPHRGVKQNVVGVQVGTKLIPEVLKLAQIPVKNMKLESSFSSSETTGVQVVQINESAELSLCYCGDKFVTSVVSANKGASVIGSTDGSKHFDVDSITARNVDPNTTPDVDDSNFITILRVKEAQYSTGDKRTAGYWEGTKTPNGEITFVQNRTHPVDKSVQVGLDLIPKTVTVEKVSVENMEVVSGQRKHDNFEQVSVGAMLYSRPTQYDQILTESKGVRVLPIRDTQDVQMEYNGEKFYTSVDSSRDFIEASYSESRNDRPRLRVHHLEFSDEVGHIESINRIKESPKVEAMTQVGAVLVPTELKLEKMSLDARQVPRLVESISTENILCPTEIAASSMLSECSGVHITSIGGLSEIALRLGQAEYKAEVQQDIKSNQTRIAIKERSISAKRSHASGYVSLIEPSPSALAFGEITNSTLHSLSSKSVQVGTILIPTAVTMEKVMVENLEVSVPLNQSRSAEVNVSAVLASSATEMTTVLTNASGIHVIPMSKVDEIGIQANGKSYIGMVEGAHQSAYSRTPSSTSTIQDQQKIVLPIASSTISGNANIEASLLQQSADLSLLHNALRSGQTTPVLRETNTFSTGSFRRPGIIHIPGQTLTPITEISSTTPHSAPKDVMDSSVQVGVRLIPNSISVQRVNKKQEIEFHNFLLSSEFQYEMMLQETVGVDVVPMKYAGKVNVMLEGDNFTSEIGSMRSDRRYASLDKSRDLLERASSTPSVMRCNQGTQVGAILLPQHLNLERMNLKSGSVNSAAILNESRTQSVLYPTNIGVDVTLSENPGLQMADFGGEVLVDFGDSSYNAKVSRTASSAEASVHLIDRSVSRGRKSSILEISLSRNRSVTPVTSTSGEMVRRYTVSTSTQVGTVLIPTKVCMTQVDVENLAVEIPLTEWKSTDLNVSAILASTGTEMMTVLSEDTGIQVVDMKDLDELGIQCGDEVYVAGVTASKPKYISDTYGPSRDYNVTSSTSNKRREVIFISVPKKLENSQLNQKATNLLNQSGDLREIHSTLSSSVSQPRLLMKSVFGTPIRFNGPLSSQQLMTARAPQPPTMICDCGRQYTVAEIERQLISMESGTIGESGRVNSRFSTNKPMRQMAASYNTYASQDGQSGIRCSCGRHLAALTACSQPVETSCSACGRRNVEVVGGLEGMTIFTCDCGRQYASGDISKLPITLPCSSCGSVDTVVVDMISSQTRGYESYHVTCEAAIKPAMVSKRLTVKIQPVGIDVGCQVGTYEMDCSVDTRLSRNQLSQLTTHDMTSELMNTPNLLRRTPSKKRTHSEESHGRHRTANICSFCRSRVMITDISTADPDDPNSYEASIRIRRVSNDDTNDNSVSTNLSRGSTLRRSFFTRGSDKRSSGSFESLRSHSVASKCVICRNEITSGDLSSSIRTSTSSLLGGGGGAVAAVGDSRVHEIADAYAQICRETDRFDGGKANLYSMLKSNKIIQTVINDYEREKHFEERRHFAEAMEFVEIAYTNENAMGKARSGSRTSP
nr:microtubule actin cross linking factor 1 [Hymenolepis microstoma]